MALLLLITGFSILPVGASHSELAFSEDFSVGDAEAMKAKGWDISTQTIDGGRLKLEGKDPKDRLYLTDTETAADALKWEDYTVEADITLDNTAVSGNDYVGALAVRASNGNNGYEFGLAIQKKGTTYIRLYNRKNKKQYKDTSVKIEWGVTYHTKVEVVGNRIKCYINDQLMLDLIDGEGGALVPFEQATEADLAAKATNLKGSVGCRIGGLVGFFDNIRVSREPEATEPTDPEPEEPDYGWFQPSEKEVPDAALFSEDFAGGTALTQKGWNSDSPLIQDGHVFLQTSDTDQGKQMIYLNQLAGVSDWNKYILEADVSISPQFEGSLTINTAGIVTKTGGSDSGYEFSLCVTSSGETYVRLYDRNTKKELKRQDFAAQAGAVYRLKVAHTGESIRCSVDGQLVIELADDPSRTGSIGLRTGGVLVGYDNVVVYPYTQVDDGDEPDFGEGIYFSEYFSGENALTDRGWSSDLPAIIDGQLQITNEVSPFYLNGKPVYTELTDYTFEADMVMTNEATATFATNMACLVARSTGATSGYEFGICIQSNGKEYVRLYDRKAKAVLAQENVDLEQNRTYHMAMTVEGNRITCYLDGEKVLDVTSDSNPAGSIGFRINGYTTLCSNIVVKKVGSGSGEKPTDPTEPSGEATTTGAADTTTTIHNAATGSVSPVALPLFLGGLSLAAVAGYLLTAKKEKQPGE